MQAFLMTALFGLTTLAEQLVHRDFPHLIIPLAAAQPDTALNTQNSFNIQQWVYTEMSFDVPSNNASYCRFDFTINLDPTRGAPWTIWGSQDPFVFKVAELPNNSINKDTDTWNKHPQPIGDVATISVWRNGRTEVAAVRELPCKKGQVAQFLLSPTGPTDGGLMWYELTDPLHGITYGMYTP